MTVQFVRVYTYLLYTYIYIFTLIYHPKVGVRANLNSVLPAVDIGARVAPSGLRRVNNYRLYVLLCLYQPTKAFFNTLLP